MAFKFYVNDVEKNIETNANFRATQDSSLDDGSLILEWTDAEETIKPRTPVRIDELNNNNEVINEWNFITLSDDVEPVSKVENKFSHRLTVVQNTHELSHKLLRNSIFQQPINEKTAETICRGHIFSQYNSSQSAFITDGTMHLPLKNDRSGDADYRTDKVYIGSREKINNVIIEIDTWCLCFHSASFGLNQMNISVNPRPTQKRNLHGTFTIQLQYRATENASVSSTTNVTISAGSGINKKIIVNVAKSFFETNGVGWYSMTILNFPTFSGFSQSDLTFSYTQDDLIANNLYPMILANIYLKLRIDTYYYTLQDVLEQIQKQSKKVLSNEQRASTPYTLPSDTILEEIVAPDFQFNGGSVFDAVSKVFEYIDAVPILSKTNELGFEYLNDFNGTQLASDYKFADKKTRIEDKYYDNQIVTQFSNAKQDESVWYPGKNLYRRLESNVYGIVSSANNYQFVTDKPIEQIYSLNIYLYNTYFNFRYYCNFRTNFNNYSDVQITTLVYSLYLPDYKVDIASKIYESTVYKTLPIKSVEDLSEDHQNNTLPFTRNSKSIAVGEIEELNEIYYNLYITVNNKLRSDWAFENNTFFELTDSAGNNYPSYNETYYSIEYKATFNGQAMVESPENKKEGQFVVAQSGTSTAINKMGSNMLGFIARTGNESKAVTMQLNTYDQRLTKGSMWQDSQGNRWIANIVKITFTTTNEIITEVEFVKNFNQLSQRVQVDEEIKYYMVDESISTKGFENVNEYLYFSKEAIETSETTSYTDTLLEGLFRGTFSNDASQKRVDYCDIHFDSIGQVYVPLHVYGVGNVICFEIMFDHPTSAGSYVTDSGNIKSEPVLYTDNDGFGDKFYALMRSSDYITEENTYPIHTTPDYNEVLIGFNYEYWKRPNEIFSFNYGIALLPLNNEEIYFGEKFISSNYLMNNLTNRRLYLWVSENERYGINDKKAKGQPVSSQKPGMVLDTTNRTISFNVNSTIDLDGISWCIADENDNIYIAVNQEVTLTTGYQVKLYYAKRKQRI